MIALERLNQVPRFAGLPDETKTWLAEQITARSYRKDEPIFHEGEDCTHFLLVEQGAVKIVKFLESGRELILGIFRSGEAIGEVALIDNAGFPASAVAHEACQVLQLPRAEYLRLLRSSPEAPMAIIRDLTLRMRTLSRRVQDLGGGGVDYRLARVLHTLGRRAGKQTEAGVEITMRLTRQDLADLIGARTETVIRTLSRWQDADWIASDRAKLILRAPDRLAEIAAKGGS